MSPTDMLQLDAKNTGLVGARTHSHFFGRDHWAIKCVWGTHGSRNHQLSFRCNLALSLYIENKWDYFSILPGNNHVYWWIGFHTLFSYNTHFFPVLCKCKKKAHKKLVRFASKCMHNTKICFVVNTYFLFDDDHFFIRIFGGVMIASCWTPEHPKISLVQCSCFNQKLVHAKQQIHLPE